MVFSTPFFVTVFLPLALGGYYLVARWPRVRRLVLAGASVVFYGWWDPRLVPLLVGSVTVTWLVARAFARSKRRAWLALGVAAGLGTLAFFKYADFLASSVLALLGRGPSHLDIVLPLGISFFTFQQISYLVDLRRGQAPIYGYLDWFLYVTYFPQLIAGPIVRHDEIIDQFRLDPRRDEMWENLGRGAVLFLLGLAKKVLLADRLARLVDPLYAEALGGGSLGFVGGWAAAGGFLLQVYFDFSGYSDMAVGMGRMCGFDIPLNFDAPLRAASLTDFWRRWHMTLSRFFRDYLYIPLGGNRKGRPRQAANIVVTMVLCGLWHGAGWTYVAWGGTQGVGLALNVAWRKGGRSLGPALGWATTLGYFVATIVVFRASTFVAAGRILASMAGVSGLGGIDPGLGRWLVLGWILALLGPTSQEIALQRLAPRRLVAAAAGAAVAYLVLLLGEGFHPEFIYFQF